MSEKKKPTHQDLTFDRDHELRLMRLEVVNESRHEVFKDIKESISKIDTKIGNLENKIDSKIERLENKMEILDQKISKNFYWTLAGFAAICGAFAGVYTLILRVLLKIP